MPQYLFGYVLGLCSKLYLKLLVLLQCSSTKSAPIFIFGCTPRHVEISSTVHIFISVGTPSLYLLQSQIHSLKLFLATTRFRIDRQTAEVLQTKVRQLYAARQLFSHILVPKVIIARFQEYDFTNL